MSTSSIELEPWLIVLGQGADSALALWRLDDQQGDALAVFSNEVTAETYAGQNCGDVYRVVQLRELALIRTLADCFGQGIRYATLDPGPSRAQRVFVIRDVLLAARQRLSDQRDRQARSDEDA